MIQDNQCLPFSELVLGLQQLCHERRTGLVLIRPGGPNVARITLVNGEIVAIVFHGKSGSEALPQLATIDSGQLHFIEGQFPTSKILPPPATEDILADLATQTAQSANAKATETTDNGSWDEQVPEIKTVLETALSEYIGPMARLVCESQWEKGQDLETIIKALAAKIPQPLHRKQFIQEVCAQLSLPTSEQE